MNSSQTNPDPFLWPPKSDEDESINHNELINSDHESENGQLSHSKLKIGLESIEEHLLGRTSLSFGRWADRTRWKPDSPSMYCWRCAGSVGPHESDGEGCARCRTTKLPWERAIRLSVYKEQVQTEIQQLKFHRQRTNGDVFGRYLGFRIIEQLELADIPRSQAVLVPIPMHRLRRMTRGLDHTLSIAQSASRISGCQVIQALNARYRPEQVGKTMTARAQNMKKAFSLRERDLKK